MADRIAELRELVESAYVFDDEGHAVISVTLRFRKLVRERLDMVDARLRAAEAVCEALDGWLRTALDPNAPERGPGSANYNDTFEVRDPLAKWKEMKDD